MTLPIGADAPDLALPDGGTFHVWRARRWALLIAAKALSPTCSTEFVQLAGLFDGLADRGVAVVALLADPAPAIARWTEDLRDALGVEPRWPMVADKALRIAGDYALTDRAGTGLQRAALLIAPDGTVALSLAYPVTTGRNFAEMLRAIVSIQLTAAARVATPAEWLPGDRVMLPPSLAQADAEQAHPDGVEVVRPYLRYVAQPAT